MGKQNIVKPFRLVRYQRRFCGVALLWSCSVLWDEAETCHVFRNLMLTSRDEIFGTHPHFVSCAQF